jgi:glycosyltransferase involved in cell wall biosynthesis
MPQAGEVAHFIQRYPPALGGSEAYFARLGSYLASGGTNVTVCTTTALALEAFWSRGGATMEPGITTDEGVEVRRYGLWRWPGRRYLLKALSLIPQRRLQCLTLPCNPIAWGMWRDAGRLTRRFDLVHATAFPYAWPIVCGLRLARRLGIPFLLTPFLHLGDPDDPRDATRKAYTSAALLSLVHAADRVFVQTEAERQELLRRGLPAKKLVLQGLGVDAAECTGGARQPTRERWHAGPDDVVIGHLANNSVEKGSVDLLRAAEQLWRAGRRFHLVLAGPEMANFQRFVRSYPFAERVQRLDVLDETQKRDFYAALDVFALPSRTDSFGLVLLEAWANGLPNVGYRAGGVAEVIRHERDGLLVRCGDVAGLAAALDRLIADRGLRRRLGEEGRQRTTTEFRWCDKLALVRAVYDEVVELASRPA